MNRRRLLSLSLSSLMLLMVTTVMTTEVSPPGSRSVEELREILMEEARIKQGQIQRRHNRRIKRSVDDHDLYSLFIDYFENGDGVVKRNGRRQKRSIAESELDMTHPIEINFPESDRAKKTREDPHNKVHSGIVRPSSSPIEDRLTNQEIRELTRKSDLGQILSWLDALSQGREHDVTAALIMAKNEKTSTKENDFAIVDDSHNNNRSELFQRQQQQQQQQQPPFVAPQQHPSGGAPLPPQGFYMQYLPSQQNIPGGAFLPEHFQMEKNINSNDEDSSIKSNNRIGAAAGVTNATAGTTTTTTVAPRIVTEIVTNPSSTTSTSVPSTATTSMSTSAASTKPHSKSSKGKNKRKHGQKSNKFQSVESDERSSKDNSVEKESIKLKRHQHSDKAKKHHQHQHSSTST